MQEYKYLIIGGGMTADAAVRGILQIDEQASIGMICAEAYPPYNRPPLSKSLWKGKKEASIWRHTGELAVTLNLNTTAVDLDAAGKVVTDNNGVQYHFEKLLLATGGDAMQLPFGNDEVIYFRNLADYYRLRTLTEKYKNFTVIGGGFIGSEIAAALTIHGRKVTMIFPENGIAGNIFPAPLSVYLNEYFADRGVAIHNNCLVQGIRSQSGSLLVDLHIGADLITDAVVAGIGINPNIALARSAGLQTGKGIVVNRTLQTSHADIYAAGDVAEIHNSALDTHMVVEHEENANMGGFIAGQNMAGEEQAYDYLPYFYSSLFDISYEGVGKTAATLETVCDWQEPFRKGMIYYLENQRVCGVIAWNLRKTMKAARRLIEDPGPFSEKKFIR